MKTKGFKVGDKINIFNSEHTILHVPNEDYGLFILEYLNIDKWLQKSIQKKYYSTEQLELILFNHEKYK